MIRISLVCPFLPLSVTIIVFLLRFPSHSCPFHLSVSSMNSLWRVWECIISVSNVYISFLPLCPLSYFSLCFCHFPVFYVFQNRHWISFGEYGNVQSSYLPCVPIPLSVFILGFIILSYFLHFSVFFIRQTYSEFPLESTIVCRLRISPWYIYSYSPATF